MFKAERDEDFEGQGVVVELSDDYNRDGRVVGFTTGDEAMDDADCVACLMSETGHQPTGADRERYHYTAVAGEEF